VRARTHKVTDDADKLRNQHHQSKQLSTFTKVSLLLQSHARTQAAAIDYFIWKKVPRLTVETL